ncbi:MAG: ATP-binding cassette domain-containing protein [Ardenticatenia bacterium]|nr:ATP-binding cassette domain-containing protein [Ardenticatenia bacterium]
MRSVRRVKAVSLQPSRDRSPAVDAVALVPGPNLSCFSGATFHLSERPVLGPSGAGKSTLSMLLGRFYDVNEGAVLLDGQDIRGLKLDWLRGQMAMVTQETFLFHTTVLENLRYGRPEATLDEVVAAAQAAQIHDLISGLPEGYQTVTGDRGYRFSGGERQRLAIARAILKNPRILILDEATSALDSHNESLVKAALEPLMRDRTSLVIAHRLSTIVQADQIVVIDGGRITERGTHAELLALGGWYARMFQEQGQGGGRGVMGAGCCPTFRHV